MASSVVSLHRWSVRKGMEGTLRNLKKVKEGGGSLWELGSGFPCTSYLVVHQTVSVNCMPICANFGQYRKKKKTINTLIKHSLFEINLQKNHGEKAMSAPDCTVEFLKPR